MVDVFATGLVFGESPRWHVDERGGRLWVCDWMAGQVLSYAADGTPTVEWEMTGLPFSVDWLPDRRAVLTSAVGVVAGPDLTAYGGEGQGWNEIVVDAHGNVFVNAAGYDMMAGEDPRLGFVCVVRADGTTTRVADDVMFPNGMAISPDGTTLVVAESHADRLTAYDVAADGTLSGRRTFAEVAHAPDGICFDADGAVWYASVPGRCCERVADGGEVLERVVADRGCFACMLGGDDGRTLYVVAQEWGGTAGMDGPPTGQVLTHPVDVPHAGRP